MSASAAATASATPSTTPRRSRSLTRSFSRLVDLSFCPYFELAPCSSIDGFVSVFLFNGSSQGTQLFLSSSVWFHMPPNERIVTGRPFVNFVQLAQIVKDKEAGGTVADLSKALLWRENT